MKMLKMTVEALESKKKKKTRRKTHVHLKREMEET